MVNLSLGFGSVTVTTNVNKIVSDTSSYLSQQCNSGSSNSSVTENVTVSITDASCASINVIQATAVANASCTLQAASKSVAKTVAKQAGTAQSGGLNLQLKDGSFETTTNVSSTESQVRNYLNQVCAGSTNTTLFKDLSVVAKGLGNTKNSQGCKDLNVVQSKSSNATQCVLRAYQDMVNNNKTLQSGTTQKGVGMGAIIGDCLLGLGMLVGVFVIVAATMAVLRRKKRTHCLALAAMNNGHMPPVCAKIMKHQFGVDQPPPGGLAMSDLKRAATAGAASAMRKATQEGLSKASAHYAKSLAGHAAVHPAAAPVKS